MAFFLRACRLLSIVVWVGGLISFAAIEAPIAFHVMGASLQFALLIGRSLGALNAIGHGCGFAFLLASIGLWFRTDPRGRRLLVAEVSLIVLMLAATTVVRSSIIPAMERDRATAGGDINALPSDSPIRLHFDRMHSLSEKVEGSALFFGLGIVLLLAAEPAPRQVVSGRSSENQSSSISREQSSR